MLQGAVSAGDIVNGNLRYSTTAPDQDSSPLFGAYEVGDMYLVRTGFGANPSGEFKLRIWNASEDRIRVRQNGTVAAFNVSSVDLAAEGIDSMYLEIELEDENGNALSSDQLPPSLDLAAWTSKRFEINAYDGNTKRWYIVGTIGNIWNSN
jgi:hypothetical protein